MNWPPLGAALVLAAALAGAGPAHAAFQDPLDAPALRSALAAQGLFTALARAGTRLVAVGQRGHILHSDDGGKTWTQATVPVSIDLTAVVFATPRRGWAVGHGGVVLTTADAGSSWTKQFDGRALGTLLVAHFAEHGGAGLTPEALALQRREAARVAEEGPDKPFLDVWFADEMNGYAVGVFNLILKTSDGGKSWVPWTDRVDNPKRLHFYALRPVGADLYLVGEQGLVLRLDAAAQRFKAVPVDYQGTFFGVVGKPGVVLVHGLRGNVFRSLDGGGSWQRVDTGLQASLTGSAVTADGRIVLVSQAGHVLVSRDDGASFRKLAVEQPRPATAVTPSVDDALALAGLRGLRVLPLK
jgi:photosystem II stability/assembly factor-like uncharacterized protein